MTLNRLFLLLFTTVFSVLPPLIAAVEPVKVEGVLFEYVDSKREGEKLLIRLLVTSPETNHEFRFYRAQNDNWQSRITDGMGKVLEPDILKVGTSATEHRSLEVSLTGGVRTAVILEFESPEIAWGMPLQAVDIAFSIDGGRNWQIATVRNVPL
jgi:hypothetical protein